MKVLLPLQRLFESRMFAAFFLSLLFLNATAQGDTDRKAAIEVLRSGIPHDALFSLEMTGEWGVAIGNYGLMLETNDGGLTWNVLPKLTNSALLGIARAGDHTVIVGQKGLLVSKTGDGEWLLGDSGLGARLLNVGMNEDGLAVTVGEFGMVGRSSDFGQTWEATTIDWTEYNDEGYEPHLYEAVVSSDGSVMIAGEFGLILRSEDGGSSWTKVAEGDESVFDIDLATDGSNSGFAVGQDGLLLRTKDNGRSWERRDAGTNANLLGVWSGESEVAVVGIRTLLRSGDDGNTFSAAEDYAVIRNWYQGIDAGVVETAAGEEGFLREQFVYIAGHEGSIAKIVD